jgi:hypothetical protein
VVGILLDVFLEFVGVNVLNITLVFFMGIAPVSCVYRVCRSDRCKGERRKTGQFPEFTVLLIALSPFVFLLKSFVTLLKTGKTWGFSQGNDQNQIMKATDSWESQVHENSIYSSVRPRPDGWEGLF